MTTGGRLYKLSNRLKRNKYHMDVTHLKQETMNVLTNLYQLSTRDNQKT